MNAKTRENLLVAMHGEAFDFARYMLFAKRAREDGQSELGDLFEKTANTEILDHFTTLASLAGLVGTGVENLEEAIRGEEYEIATMYPEFLTQAGAAGETGAARRFTQILATERAHQEAFRAALLRLERKKTAAPPGPKPQITTD